MAFRPVPCTAPLTLGDHRRFPGCRMLLACSLCGWSRAYDPMRVIARLQALRAGGYPTPLATVARRVGRPCPGCGRVTWRADLAWPSELSQYEIKRLANLYRN
jgi:hypothetical protein